MIAFDDDAQVLESLTAALAPAPVEPTFLELVALRSAVTEHAARRRTGFLHRLRRPVPAAVLALSLAGGAAGVAVVSGAVMPRPVRTVVRAVGLPVESAAVARIRHDMEELRDALDSGDPNAVAPAAARLRRDAARLSASDSEKVHDEVASLLVTADRVLAAPGTAPASGTGESPVTTAPVPVAPTAPPTTAAARPAAGPATTTSLPQSGDDHGGSSGSGSSDSGNSGPGSTSSGSGGDGSDDGGTSGHSGPG